MSERTQAERALRRVEELITNLDALPETRARDVARELLEAVLDLHGTAFIRLAAIVAASGQGDTLSAAMAEDEQVAAVLLLYGLHPDMADVRVRRALQKLRPSLHAQGADVHLIEVAGGVARLRLRIPGASREQAAMLRREVEEALVEAAPDLDEIAILNDVANEMANRESLAAAS
ncbi:MAG TPA: hypothetical protein VH000_02705 [Rhizomicrobium sp.]|jgi:hypothetical protein|nr:hypothetical protein [Rhizomicrobium sp.]